jgi:hypothetical protein
LQRRKNARAIGVNLVEGSKRMTLYWMMICTCLTLGLAFGCFFDVRAVSAVPDQALKDMIYLDTKDKIFHGGRGSGKSHSMATALVAAAIQGCERVLCCREFHTSPPPT